MTKMFEKKVALVTGAASGIGRATAVAFGREGARVIVSDADGRSGEETVHLVRQAGGEALFCRCDVTRSQDIEAMLAGTNKAYGQLDVAFNNAGIEGVMAPCGDYPEDAWTKVLNTNLTGVFLCMKAEIGQMLKQDRGGVIVNNSSILGKVGLSGASAYVAAKHGVLGLTKTAAIEYAPKNIRINAVCPAFIQTPMIERALFDPLRKPGEPGNPDAIAEAMLGLANLHPMKRIGQANEVAEAVLWLCSPKASFVTGEGLLVDGGYVAQ
jgi:NAD(P)-dependent dehydrogenase (short-subunit alcohol dehydrogenase family)